jgi:hypothetical protein
MHRAPQVKWPSNPCGAKSSAVIIDSKQRGRAAQVAIEVRPDAFWLCVPMQGA